MLDVELDPPGLIGPRSEISRQVAEVLFHYMDDIEQKAGEAGQVEQSYEAEKYEWCRLVAMLIEDAMVEAHGGWGNVRNKNNPK